MQKQNDFVLVRGGYRGPFECDLQTTAGLRCQNYKATSNPMGLCPCLFGIPSPDLIAKKKPNP